VSGGGDDGSATVTVTAALMTVEVMNVQQQQGGSDCGLFAIAFATSLVFGKCPALRCYTQKSMRKHLIDCLENKEMQPFHSRARNKKFHSAVLRCNHAMVICTCRQTESGREIQCDECQQWYHLKCVGIYSDIDFSGTWFCPSCK